MKETKKKTQANNNNNNEEKKIKLILGIMLILLVLTLASIIMLVTKLFEKKEEPRVPYVTGVEKNEKLVERLKGKSEYARMKIYLGDIVRKLNEKNYSELYKRLEPSYKEKYFKTLEEFEKYFKEYYPESFSIKHVNFEAIGDYYVVESDIISNNSKEENKNKKGLYFVFREYDFNDYVFSFSKNK